MTKIDFANVPIEWDDPPPDDIREEIESLVRSDMKRSLSRLKSPENLLFHTVFIGDDYDGPSVCVGGREGGFEASYAAKTEWR